MLPEVARQILHLHPELGEMLHATIARIEARRGHVAADRVGRIDELELVHHFGEPIDDRLVDPERLANFARRAASAIGDDVGRHRRAMPAVLFVDVLDHALAAIAARQIDVDVRPLAALLRQEPFEEQIHADRIDRRDAEAVAHGAVGGRPAALHQDVLLPAVIDDVPDDEEVAGEIELLDEIELARNLRTRLVVIGTVAIPRAHFGDLAQKRDLGFARRDRIAWEAIAEIVHRELQPLGERQRFAHRLGLIGEQPHHLHRRLQIPLGIGGQTAARRIEGRVLANGGEHVEERPIVGRSKPHAAGRHQRHAKGVGEAHQRVVVVFLIAAQMPLQFDVHIAATEQPDQPIEQAADAVAIGQQQRPTRQRHQPAGQALEIVERERAFAFRRPQLHARDQAAQVAPAFL